MGSGQIPEVGYVHGAKKLIKRTELSKPFVCQGDTVRISSDAISAILVLVAARRFDRADVWHYQMCLRLGCGDSDLVESVAQSSAELWLGEFGSEVELLAYCGICLYLGIGGC